MNPHALPPKPASLTIAVGTAMAVAVAAVAPLAAPSSFSPPVAAASCTGSAREMVEIQITI